MRSRFILGLILMLFGQFIWAADGVGAGGGGDICEDQIKVIRDDLRDWIHEDGAKGVEAPIQGHPRAVQVFDASLLIKSADQLHR